MQKAFTLIELLVVVLIIGILSAVALPQYEKAVGRARVTEAIMNLNELIRAQDVYYLSNNAYTDDLSKLDIEVQDSAYYAYSCKQPAWTGACEATPKKEGLPVFEFHFSTVDNGSKWCQTADVTMSATGKAKALNICKTLGPALSSPKNYYAVE